eukprot:CAMPEP_0174358692 /NCGR_PEP_ID=MMETSP0811_2-20130205/44099_1 /TAXON_ID=73025 ORGANISM="Eutreptiella gymnastica-like, Strain CCMP1594" /NCGR_SAMPLE_ID=MMETSP0811_2 /ASSEMBLY_ACC=CAM_ASM_000667 /LENGTH=51 /DNA_ID=CAMNT_0015492685 /DNA_START=257 /DNA_END=412 /DNA_ORIENTATION=+
MGLMLCAAPSSQPSLRGRKTERRPRGRLQQRLRAAGKWFQWPCTHMLCYSL